MRLYAVKTNCYTVMTVTVHTIANHSVVFSSCLSYARTWFLWPTRVWNQKSISIDSAILLDSRLWAAHRETHHVRYLQSRICVLAQMQCLKPMLKSMGELYFRTPTPPKPPNWFWCHLKYIPYVHQGSRCTKFGWNRFVFVKSLDFVYIDIHPSLRLSVSSSVLLQVDSWSIFQPT